MSNDSKSSNSNSSNSDSSSRDRRVTPPHVVLPRLTWFFFGPCGLAFSGLALVTGKGGWITPPSIIYLVVLGAMAGGRYLEQKSGNGLNAAGEPSTWDDYHKYVRTVMPALFGVWVVLNVIGMIAK